MEWLNYHHLLYFRTAAKEGSIKEAARALRLTEPTVSKQIKLLEESLGEQLFARKGRRLVLTEMGMRVAEYADEIFDLGQDIVDLVQHHPTGRMPRLQVGVAYTVPKLIARELLKPALTQEPACRLRCHEGTPEHLIDELLHHRIDLVVTDQPPGPRPGPRVYTHNLGSLDIGFFMRGHLARELTEGFPSSLDGLPTLLPTNHAALRRALDRWFSDRGIQPMVVAEFDDSAMLKVFAELGIGAFPAPLFVADEIASMYGAELVGKAEGVSETYYAITLERKIAQPTLKELLEKWQGFF